MRIAYLINRYPAISHSFIRREILALERQGHDVLRISLRGWDDKQFGPEDESEQARTRYVLRDGAMPLLAAFLNVLVTSPKRLFNGFLLVWKLGRRAERPFPIHVVYLFEACRIAGWLRQEAIEHLHAHFGTNSAEVAMLVGELGGPTWSVTIHGPEEFDKAKFIGLTEKIERANFVVAVSSFGRSQLFRNVSHEYWNKIKVIHCGLEPTFHQAIDDKGPGDARRLICVGRLCEQKGQFLLLEAVRELVARGVELQLVLVGDGEIRSEIESVIESYGLQQIVRITGWISSDEVRAELLAARALVLSSFAEGLPVAIMEAMVLRRPVISTFVGGIPELVQSGQHGWLIPGGDVIALAGAMESCLAASDDTISEMGERARRRVLERHDIDKETAKLVTLFAAEATYVSAEATYACAEGRLAE
jgi:colanic acid/amylovoran biosynthesis glycosyltransferase